MRLGLGTGSTVTHLLDALGERVRSGLSIVGVPTSARTEAQARRLGIPLATLDEAPELDLCIDGADEVDSRLDCLKGLGGACVREKVVAAASRRLVLIVDETKLVDRLGTRAPVVVEVIPFALAPVLRALRDLDPFLRRTTRVEMGRSSGETLPRAQKWADSALAPAAASGLAPAPPYVTDNGNLLLELRTGPIAQPASLASRLDSTPGVLDHGLFLGMAHSVYVASASGVRRIDR